MSKIVMLSRLFYPHIGGVEKHVMNLSRELILRGYDVSVITEQFDPGLSLNETINKIKVFRIKNSELSRKFDLLSYIKQFNQKIMSADIVHIHDVFWWFIPFLFHKPYYITFHGYEVDKPKIKVRLHRKVAELLSSGSICIGDFMRKWYLANPTYVSYGSVKKLSMINKKKNENAIFWGRLDNDVGYNMYVEALKYLDSDFHLSIYGIGIFKKVKSKQLTYHVPKYNVTNIIKTYKYAFVSRYLSILEGMAAKMVICAVYNSEIKKDYLTCHPQAKNMLIAGSARELASLINTLTPKREKQMTEEAYAWAKEQTWEKLANQYEKLWGINDN